MLLMFEISKTSLHRKGQTAREEIVKVDWNIVELLLLLLF